MYMKKPNNLIRDIMYYTPAHVIPMVLAFISITIFTRSLTLDEYGRYTIAISTLFLVGNIVFAWLNFASFRFYDENKNAMPVFFSTTFIIDLALLIGLATVGLGISVFGLLDNSTILKGFPMLVFLVLLGAKTAFDQLLLFQRAERRSKRYGIFRTVDAFLKLGFALLFLFGFNWGVNGILLGMALSFATLSTIELFQNKKFGELKTAKFSSSLLNQMFSYGMPLMGAGVAMTMLSIGDRYLLAYFYDASQVALYAAGYRLAEVMLEGPGTILLLAYNPLAIKEYNENGDNGLRSILTDSLHLNLFLLIPIIFGVTALSRHFVSVVFDSRYHDVYKMFVWICCGTLCVSINHVFTRIFELKNKTKAVFFISVAAALINVIANIVLMPRYGYLGAAAATFLSYCAQCAISIFVSRRLLPLSIPLRGTVNLVVASIVMFGFLYVFDKITALSVGVLGLMVKSIAGVCIYGIAMYFLGDTMLRNLMTHVRPSLAKNE
jgi:O-antigen/teichoic acid export membrane protein